MNKYVSPISLILLRTINNDWVVSWGAWLRKSHPHDDPPHPKYCPKLSLLRIVGPSPILSREIPQVCDLDDDEQDDVVMLIMLSLPVTVTKTAAIACYRL